MAAVGEDLGDRVDSVKVARSDDNRENNITQQNSAKQPGKTSLSVSLTLPMLNPNPSLPQVLLSEQHKKLCLKRVGDAVGDVDIKDIMGRDINLSDELSDRFTVLIFWNEKSVAAYEQFRRIPVDVLAKFAPHRVKVVTVNVGGTVQETRRLTGKAANKILSLADTNSKLFEQFATKYIPRTYILDAEGRIVWLEMEYSESTRRGLENALTYFLQQTPQTVQ